VTVTYNLPTTNGTTSSKSPRGGTLQLLSEAYHLRDMLLLLFMGT